MVSVNKMPAEYLPRGLCTVGRFWYKSIDLAELNQNAVHVYISKFDGALCKRYFLAAIIFLSENLKWVCYVTMT